MSDLSSAVDVVIIDDHRMFAESLARLLADEDAITVQAVGDSCATALQLVAQFEPRVLLIDEHMPDGSGIEVARQVKQERPETMVVMLTGDAADEVLLAAIEAGCSGFLTKDRASQEVAAAVRVAASGEALISSAQLMRLLPRLNRDHRRAGSDLTQRERDVLAHLATGRSNKAIADELFLSVNTIRNYVQSILVKLDAHSKLEAVATAVRQGIITYPVEG